MLRGQFASGRRAEPMTLTHDDPKENAAGSEVRAGAPVRGVRTTDPLVPIYALRRVRPGRFCFRSRRPTSATQVFKAAFPSRGPAAVAGPIISPV